MESTIEDTKRVGTNLFFKYSPKISNKLLSKVRQAYIIPPNSETKTEVNLPFLNQNYILTEQNKKNSRCPYQENLFISKRDLLRNIIGPITNHHKDMVVKCKKKYDKTDLKSLVLQKHKILKTLSEYLNRSDYSYDFKYTRKEITFLKRLAANYDAIDRRLYEQKIRTREIDTLLFSDNSALPQSGELLPNKDIMLSTTSVYDKKLKKDIPAVLTFSNTDQGCRFKMYKFDKTLFENKAEYKKQYFHFLNTANMSGINALNKKIAASMLNTEIGEVYVDINNKYDMQKKMEESKLFSPQKITTLLEDCDSFYYLHNLKNFALDRYYDISKPLISCLKLFGENNNIKTTFLEALAYNNVKHSPVALYMHAGCKPLTESIEDKCTTFDYTKNVWLMYKIK